MSISVTASILPITPAAGAKGTTPIQGDASPKNPFQMLYSDMLKSKVHRAAGQAAEPAKDAATKDSPADADKLQVASPNPAVPALPPDSLPGAPAASKADATDATPASAATPGNDPSVVVMQPVVLPAISSMPANPAVAAPTISDTIRPARNGDKSSATGAAGPEVQGPAAQGPAGIPAGEAPAAGFAASLESAAANPNAFVPASSLPEVTSAPVTAQSADLPGVGTTAPSSSLAQGQPAAAIEPATRELELRAHPSSPVWREGFTAQVNVLVGERVQSAEMRVHPPELGPIEIRIVTVDQQTNIMFTATHEDTRRAIEDAMPRLREVLAESGVNLDSTSVNSDRASGDTHRQAHSEAGRTSSQPEPRSAEAQVTMAPQRRLEGLIDTFA